MLQRDNGAAAPPAPTVPAIEPQNRNKRIATWVGWTDSAVKTRMEVRGAPIASYALPVGAIPASVTPAGWTPGHYETEAAALAAVRAAGTAGAVFSENGQFVAYHATGETWLSSFTFDNVRWFHDKPWTAVRFEGSPAPNVIVTEDGVALRAEHFKSEDDAKTAMADQGQMPGAGGDPLAGYKQAFGDPNKSGLLELVFYPAMRDQALSTLATSRAQVERDIERRFSSGLIPRGEIETMRQTAQQLAALDKEIEKIPKTLPYTLEEHEEHKQNLLRFNELQAKRRLVLARYPMLARVDVRTFARLPEDQQMTQLGGKSIKIRDDIDKARNDILDGTLKLWKIRSLVDATIAGLGITDPQARKRVYDLAAANQSSVADNILTLFTVAFGLASAVVTGPLGLALAAGAFGLGIADAIKETEEISAEHSAANTALDPTKSLLPPEDVRSWGWLVVAWAGVVADAAQVVSAVKAVKSASGAIETGVKALAKGDEGIARQLRLAAGAVDATEVISEASRVGLANRLGTTLEIDASLGREVRVHYHVDSRGRAVLDGVRCGPEATVGLILAHETVVKLLQRYDGLLGRLRELLDKLRSLAGFPPPGVNPFPPGSQAFESFAELLKLPDVIAARQASLGTQLTAKSEAVLRRDIEFLENELIRHQQVVDQMVLEKGLGFIAAAGEDTKKAIAAGMPDIFNNPLVKDPSKYYYRVNPDGKPPYILTRFANSDAPPLTLVPDGGGWRIAKGALSRTEEAAALVRSWPEKVREGFEALQKASSGAFKVVPLQGVAATGRKFSQIITNAQGERLVEIMTGVYTAAKEPDPLARAIVAVQNLLDHEATVVRGTDQLRAYNYRLAFEKATGAEASGDLHHFIPLYLGGGHGHLVDMPRGLHDQLHNLIDGIVLEEGVTLAPTSIQKAKSLNFSEGAAVLYNDGRVQLVRLNPDGSYTPVP